MFLNIGIHVLLKVWICPGMPNAEQGLTFCLVNLTLNEDSVDVPTTNGEGKIRKASSEDEIQPEEDIKSDKTSFSEYLSSMRKMRSHSQ